MFFEIWKRQNKKKLDELNEIAKNIQPTEQAKKIANEITKSVIYSDDLEQYRCVNGSLSDLGNKIFSERINIYLNNKEVSKNES